MNSSRIKYKELLEMLGEGIGIVNAREEFIYANHAADTLFEVEPDGLIGKNLKEFLLPEDFEKIQTETKYRQAGKTSSYDLKIISAKKHTRYITVTASPATDDSNNFIGSYAIFRDITSRINNEKILEQKIADRTKELTKLNEELKLQNLILKTEQEVSADGIIITDHKGIPFNFNKKFCDIFGINHTISRFELKEKINSLVKEYIVNPDLFIEMVNYIPTKPDDIMFNEVKFNDGRVFERYSAPIFSDENEYLGKVSYFRDITLRYSAEKSLKKLHQAIEQSPTSIIITNPDGVIEYVNNCFTKITGYSSEEIIGKKPSVFKSGKTNPDIYINLWQTITSGKEWKGELCNRKKNGELYFENVLISPVINENNKITNFITIKEDITIQKEFEQKILQTIINTEEKERQKLAQDLHDGIGPLLSATKLYVQWLAEPNTANNKAEILEKVLDLLKESQNTVRQISYNLSPLVLRNNGFSSALNSFATKINDLGNIKININSNLTKIENLNIEINLYRILTECINNTIKHAEASKIDINMSKVADTIHIEYLDNGKGFDPEQVLQSGKGIGLYNLLNRIKALNGECIIDSKISAGTKIVIFISDIS